MNTPHLYTVRYNDIEGQDSVVGLDGPGIESRWGRDFPHPSTLALWPILPPIQWVPSVSRGVGGRGVALTTRPPSSSEVNPPSVAVYLSGTCHFDRVLLRILNNCVHVLLSSRLRCFLEACGVGFVLHIAFV
jgi:hypothetical protein